jgi:hypothetical protein
VRNKRDHSVGTVERQVRTNALGPSNRAGLTSGCRIVTVTVVNPFPISPTQSWCERTARAWATDFVEGVSAVTSSECAV